MLLLPVQTAVEGELAIQAQEQQLAAQGGFSGAAGSTGELAAHQKHARFAVSALWF